MNTDDQGPGPDRRPEDRDPMVENRYLRQRVDELEDALEAVEANAANLQRLVAVGLKRGFRR